MSLSQYASPKISVEIYPYFGGKYTFTDQNNTLLQVVTNKNIRNSTGGHFHILLAPGGPGGVNDATTWSSIIIPNSLVIIRMARAGSTGTPMVGVVTSSRETQQWRANQSAGRAIEIKGSDFTFFFTNFSYFTLQEFGLVAANLFQVLGSIAGIAGGQGLVTGSPGSVGQAWYEKIMAGNNGILSVLNWAIGNQRISYNNVVAYGFEDYPAQSGATVPVSLNFMNSEGTWMQKFQTIYTFPLYEFFVNTAPASVISSKSNSPKPFYSFASYDQISKIVSSDSGIYAAGVPTVVARVNPLPYAVYDPSSDSWLWDSTRWDSLPTFSADNGFMESSIQMDASEVRNFYLFLPNFVLALTGGSISNIVSSMEQYGLMADFSSLDRFGYRPAIIDTLWYADPAGYYAIKNAAAGVTQNDFIKTFVEITSRIASYYEPTPSMFRGEVTIPLRPDIIPGCKFRYNPYKGDVNGDYLFYIEGVTHNWIYGGQTTTKLELARGLAETDYSDTALMIKLHTGSVHRIDGKLQEPVYAKNVNAPKTLTYFSNQVINAEFMKDLPGIFVTPGAT